MEVAVVQEGNTQENLPEVMAPVPHKRKRSGRKPGPFRSKIAENLEQRALFEEYVKMGAKRSLPKLLAHTTRSIMSIQNWSKRFDWVERARQADHAACEIGLLETPRETVERKKTTLDLINWMIVNTANLDENGKVIGSKVGVRSVNDLKLLNELREELMGQRRKEVARGDINVDKAVFIIKK
jgi:hypothetical protein